MPFGSVTLTTCSERCEPRAKPPADFTAAPMPRPRGSEDALRGPRAAVRPRSSAAKGAGAGAALPGAPGARWVRRDAPLGGRRAGPARPRPGAQGTGPPGRWKDRAPPRNGPGSCVPVRQTEQEKCRFVFPRAPLAQLKRLRFDATGHC
ncbi:Triple Functional Domain Protein [Manis pentadactyla]|nr:Triple Functional Domain Protein [Manis pentadactyla]